MSMTIVDYGQEYHIKWEYNPRYHTHYVNSVKSIGINDSYEKWVNGKKEKFNTFQKTWSFNPKKKEWIVPKDKRTDDQVKNLIISCRAKIRVPDEMKPEITGEIPELPSPRQPLTIKGVPRDYQGKGIQHTADLMHVINGDEMGLGKTYQSIGAVLLKDAFPCVVVCPATLKINWKREWEKWSDKKAIILEDKIKDKWLSYYHHGMADVFIVNYESIKKFFVHSIPPKVKGKGYGHSTGIVMNPLTKVFKSIIIDELHRCKDPDTMRTKLTLRLAEGKQMRIGLTGTLLVNKVKDIYPQLAIVGGHTHFGKMDYFLNRYCEGGSGASNLKELKYLLYKHCFFMRKKSDVAKELPPKIRQSIACDITTRVEYDKANSDFKRYLEDLGLPDDVIAKKLRGEIMVQMQKLKEISAKGKMEVVKEFVEDVLEQDKKIILFANLHEIIDKMGDMFPGVSVKITGKLNMDQKQAAIDAFQNDPTKKVALVNIKAGGVGLTLTAASHVGFIEYPYHPADCRQCEDRAHRLGITDTVFAHYFLGLNTIDERSYEIIQDKADLTNEALGDDETMQMSIVTDFLKTIRA